MATVFKKSGGVPARAAARASSGPNASAHTPDDTCDLPEGLSPDWHLGQDVACSACAYDLRGLRGTRCPECGIRFRWQALLDVHCPRCGGGLQGVDGALCPHCLLPLHWEALFAAGAERDRRSFEHAPAPLRAAGNVLVRALLPSAFLRGLSLEAPPQVRRLRALRRTAALVGIVGLSAVSALAFALGDYRRWSDAAPLVWLACAPYVAVSLLLPGFGPTLMRFRVRREQLLRVTAYSWVGFAWIGIAGLLLTLATLAGRAVHAIAPESDGGIGFRPLQALASWAGFVSPVAARSADEANWPAYVQLCAVGFFPYLWLPAFWWAALHCYLRVNRRNTTAMTVCIGLVVVLSAVLGLGATPSGAALLGRLLDRWSGR